MKQKPLKIKVKILVYIVFITNVSYGQFDSTFVYEHLLDNIESVEELVDIENCDISEEILENIQEITTNGKPNINDLSYETAVKLLHLSDYQYYQLQLYIHDYGQIYSIYELLAIDGFTKEDMYRLEGVVHILTPPKEKRTFRNLIRDGKSQFLFRYGQILEQQSGYDKTSEKHHAGNPAQLIFRYSYQNLQYFGIKISGCKDPGDQFFRGEQKYGFDRYSGAIYFQNIKWLKKAVIGDFRISFGQGLIAGYSLLSNIGNTAENLRTFSFGVRPIAVTGTSSFLRGIGITLGNNKIEGSIFIADRAFSNFSIAGVSVKYNTARFGIGAQALCFGQNDGDNDLFKNIGAVFRPKMANFSIDYRLNYRGQLFVAEFAVDEHAKIALLQTLVLNISQFMKLGILVRHYSQGYHAVAGGGFKSSSGQTGETGVYITSTIYATRRLEISPFADYCKLNWLSYNIESPTACADLGLHFILNINRNSLLLGKYRWKNKPKNVSSDEMLRRLNEQSQHKIKFQWRNSPLNCLKLTTNVSFAFNRNYDNSFSKGILIYQDLVLNFRKPNISVHLRGAYFDTDSYNERIYAYEDDVYYTFNIGSYYYQGIRGYLVMRYKIKKMSFWLRIGRTRYLNKDNISSGLNYIDRPHKTEIKTQMIIRF